MYFCTETKTSCMGYVRCSTNSKGYRYSKKGCVLFVRGCGVVVQLCTINPGPKTGTTVSVSYNLYGNLQTQCAQY